MDDEMAKSPDEEAFLGDLRRFTPAGPSTRLRSRIFGTRWGKLFRLSAAAAAVVLLCQALGVVDTRSNLPSRFVIHETLVETATSLSVLEKRNENIRFFVREEK